MDKMLILISSHFNNNPQMTIAIQVITLEDMPGEHLSHLCLMRGVDVKMATETTASGGHHQTLLGEVRVLVARGQEVKGLQGAMNAQVAQVATVELQGDQEHQGVDHLTSLIMVEVEAHHQTLHRQKRTFSL